MYSKKIFKGLKMKKQNENENFNEEDDSVDSYFNCITSCSIDEDGEDCITKCVDTHLKSEEKHD
tara:strand:+ start:1488 stop:1679 length:192 start_codon:yes stop_codon:yes gene_type:complete